MENNLFDVFFNYYKKKDSFAFNLEKHDKNTLGGKRKLNVCPDSFNYKSYDDLKVSEHNVKNWLMTISLRYYIYHNKDNFLSRFNIKESCFFYILQAIDSELNVRFINSIKNTKICISPFLDKLDDRCDIVRYMNKIDGYLEAKPYLDPLIECFPNKVMTEMEIKERVCKYVDNVKSMGKIPCTVKNTSNKAGYNFFYVKVNANIHKKIIVEQFKKLLDDEQASNKINSKVTFSDRHHSSLCKYLPFIDLLLFSYIYKYKISYRNFLEWAFPHHHFGDGNFRKIKKDIEEKILSPDYLVWLYQNIKPH